MGREADREKDEQRMKDRQKRFEDEKKKQEASTNGSSKGAEEKKATSADADEEALDFEPEAATDDTLVMEVDQHDLVDHEEKEEVINAKPGEVTSLRKLGGKARLGCRGCKAWLRWCCNILKYPQGPCARSK